PAQGEVRERSGRKGGKSTCHLELCLHWGKIVRQLLLFQGRFPGSTTVWIALVALAGGSLTLMQGYAAFNDELFDVMREAQEASSDDSNGEDSQASYGEDVYEDDHGPGQRGEEECLTHDGSVDPDEAPGVVPPRPLPGANDGEDYEIDESYYPEYAAIPEEYEAHEYDDAPAAEEDVEYEYDEEAATETGADSAAASSPQSSADVLLEVANALTVTSQRLAEITKARGYYNVKGGSGKSKGKSKSIKGKGKPKGKPSSKGNGKGGAAPASSAGKGRGAPGVTPSKTNLDLQKQRLADATCLGCGSPGHWLKDCPKQSRFSAQVASVGVVLDADGNAVSSSWMTSCDESDKKELVRYQLPALTEDLNEFDFDMKRFPDAWSPSAAVLDEATLRPSLAPSRPPPHARQSQRSPDVGTMAQSAEPSHGDRLNDRARPSMDQIYNTPVSEMTDEQVALLHQRWEELMERDRLAHDYDWENREADPMDWLQEDQYVPGWPNPAEQQLEEDKGSFVMRAGLQKRLLGNVKQVLNTWSFENKAYDRGVQQVRAMRKFQHDVVEIFGGFANITAEALEQGLRALQPVDSIYGVSLVKASDYKKLCDLLRDRRPFLVVWEIRCDPWSNINHLNFSAEELEALRAEHYESLKGMCDTIIKLHEELGMHFLLENPWGTPFWNHPQIERLMNLPHVTLRKGSMCRFGLRGKEGHLIRKHTGWLSDLSELLDELALECPGHGHQHEQCLGGNSKRAQVYTRQLARAVVKGLKRALARSGDERFIFPDAVRFSWTCGLSCTSPHHLADEAWTSHWSPAFYQAFYLDVDRTEESWRPILQEVENRLEGKVANSAIVKPGTAFYAQIQDLVPWSIHQVQICRTPKVRRTPHQLMLQKPVTHRAAVLRFDNGRLQVETEEAQHFSTTRFEAPVRFAVFIYGEAPQTSLNPEENAQNEGPEAARSSDSAAPKTLEPEEVLILDEHGQPVHDEASEAVVLPVPVPVQELEPSGAAEDEVKEKSSEQPGEVRNPATPGLVFLPPTPVPPPLSGSPALPAIPEESISDEPNAPTGSETTTSQLKLEDQPPAIEDKPASAASSATSRKREAAKPPSAVPSRASSRRLSFEEKGTKREAEQTTEQLRDTQGTEAVEPTPGASEGVSLFLVYCKQCGTRGEFTTKQCPRCDACDFVQDPLLVENWFDEVEEHEAMNHLQAHVYDPFYKRWTDAAGHFELPESDKLEDGHFAYLLNARDDHADRHALWSAAFKHDGEEDWTWSHLFETLDIDPETLSADMQDDPACKKIFFKHQGRGPRKIRALRSQPEARFLRRHGRHCSSIVGWDGTPPELQPAFENNSFLTAYNVLCNDIASENYAVFGPDAEILQKDAEYMSCHGWEKVQRDQDPTGPSVFNTHTDQIVGPDDSSDEEVAEQETSGRATRQALKREVPWQSISETDWPKFVSALRDEWQEWETWSSCQPVELREGEV
ncbi:unnamed protein product, partial [Cladocopium goreaui]